MATHLAEHILSGKAKAEHKGGKHPKKVHKMHITKAHSGGYHVVHEHSSPHPPEEHVIPNTDALHDHIEEHYGEPNPGEEAAEPVAQAQGDEYAN